MQVNGLINLHLNFNLKFNIGFKMKKIITVYVVSSDDKKVTFATKSKANDAIDLLSKFDIQAELEQVKREIEIQD